MKNQFILLFFLFLFFLESSAQDNKYIDGTPGIEFNIGKARYGQYFAIGASIIKGEKKFKIYYKVLAGHEFGNYKGFSRSRTFLEAGAYSKLFAINNTVFFNWFAGAAFSMDNLSGFEGIDKKTYFGLGPAVGVETEIFLNDKIVLLLNFKQRFIVTGKFSTYYNGGIGIKYNL